MSRMTADDMVTYVRKSLGGVPVGALSDAEILHYINLTYIEICSSKYMPILESSEVLTTVANTAEYEMTSSDILFFWQAVDETDNYVLNETDRRAYNDGTQGTAQTGSPTRWFASGVGANNRRQVTLWPTPTKVSSIRFYYQRRPAYLVQETSPTSSIIYETYDSEILSGAVAKGLEYLGRYQEAAAVRGLLKSYSTAPSIVKEHDESGFGLGNNVAYDANWPR